MNNPSNGSGFLVDPAKLPVIFRIQFIIVTVFTSVIYSSPRSIMIPHVRKVLVLGGGSAGFLAAISIKTVNPTIDVEVIRSPEIGIIGVGEATTPLLPAVLHGDLNLDLTEFYRDAQPAWKLGIRLLWGPQKEFHYTFHYQTEHRHPQLSRNLGYYCWDEFHDIRPASSLMSVGRVFMRRPDGFPLIERDAAYHIENEHFVTFLEAQARRLNIVIRDDTVQEVKVGDRGVDGLVLAKTGLATADLYVDCSGFRAMLIRQALKDPHISYKKSLYCDRAVVGGWTRENEPIMPYTTAETMNAGWCWQIEHEGRINRGYVYSSDFISDDDATREFLAICPKITNTRIVKFASGRQSNSWVKNVVAVGNASGFVEPLESTSLTMIAMRTKAIAAILHATGGVITDTCIREFNKRAALNWDAIRDFLAIHYRFNTRLQTPFWKACVADVELCGAAPIVEYYQENGPCSLWKGTLLDLADFFGLEGYWTLLMGQKVPYNMTFQPSSQERDFFRMYQQYNRQKALAAMTCEEAYAAIRRPEWTWNNEFYKGRPGMQLSNA